MKPGRLYCRFLLPQRRGRRRQGGQYWCLESVFPSSEKFPCLVEDLTVVPPQTNWEGDSRVAFQSRADIMAHDTVYIHLFGRIDSGFGDDPPGFQRAVYAHPTTTKGPSCAAWENQHRAHAPCLHRCNKKHVYSPARKVNVQTVDQSDTIIYPGLWGCRDTASWSAKLAV